MHAEPLTWPCFATVKRDAEWLKELGKCQLIHCLFTLWPSSFISWLQEPETVITETESSPPQEQSAGLSSMVFQPKTNVNKHKTERLWDWIDEKPDRIWDFAQFCWDSQKLRQLAPLTHLPHQSQSSRNGSWDHPFNEIYNAVYWVKTILSFLYTEHKNWESRRSPLFAFWLLSNGAKRVESPLPLRSKVSARLSLTKP